MVNNTQHRMSLLDRGGLQDQSALEPVASQVWAGEQKLRDVLGRHPLSSAAPSSDFRHVTPHCLAQISALFEGQV